MTSLSPKRRLGGLLTAAALSLAAGSWAAGGASAAERAVEVDLSVIDALPPRPVGLAPPPIRLAPPSAGPARAATVRAKAPVPGTAAAPAKAPAAPQSAPTQQAAPPRQPEPAKQAAPARAVEAAAPKTAAAAPTAPPPAARPAAPREPAQTAARPAAIAKASLPFPRGGEDLTAPLQARLAPIIDAMIKAPTARLVIHAYADGRDQGPGVARRMSLARALAVRNHLVAKGIDGTRAEIRPLGDTSPAGSVDRVDLVLVNR